MPSKPEPILTPLVSEGLALIAEAEGLKSECDALKVKLSAKADELEAVNLKLIAMGAGRYCDTLDHTATVVAEIPATLGADRFSLPRAEGSEEKARALAREAFSKLFERHVSYTCRQGFGGIAGAVLTPAKARDLVGLCIIPGVMGGGRKAYVRWK